MSEIKYVEVPVRVKPHHEYLDMKGVEELWVQIKEYVGEHGGENGSVNEDEVNALIAAYYAAHRDELKGDPFTYADFTPEQLAELKGETGAPGEKGDPFTYNDFTEEQLLALKGEKGEPGQDGTVSFDELTDEQILSLKGDKGDTGEKGEQGIQGEKGEKGDKGADGTMSFEDLTDEQRESLKGDKGDVGERGKPFTFDDFTPEQLESLRGAPGLQGPKGDTGATGPKGEQGVPGVSLPPDMSNIYTKAEVDDLLKNVDLDPDDINLENYYTKEETYNKEEVNTIVQEIEIEGGGAGVHVGTEAPTNPLTAVWVDTDGLPYDGNTDLGETFYTKAQVDDKIDNHKNLSEMVNDIGFITDADIPTRTSDLTNDSLFVTGAQVYDREHSYSKEQIDTTLESYCKKTEVPDAHTHNNKTTVLDKLSVIDGKLGFDGAKVDTAVEIPDIDLSDYATVTMLDAVDGAKANKVHTHEEYPLAETVQVSLDAKADKSQLSAYTTTAALNTKLSQYATLTYVDNAVANTGGGEWVVINSLSSSKYIAIGDDITTISTVTKDMLNNYTAIKANMCWQSYEPVSAYSILPCVFIREKNLRIGDNDYKSVFSESANKNNSTYSYNQTSFEISKVGTDFVEIKAYIASLFYNGSEPKSTSKTYALTCPIKDFESICISKYVISGSYIYNLTVSAK